MKLPFYYNYYYTGKRETAEGHKIIFSFPAVDILKYISHQHDLHVILIILEGIGLRNFTYT